MALIPMTGRMSADVFVTPAPISGLPITYRFIGRKISADVRAISRGGFRYYSDRIPVRSIELRLYKADNTFVGVLPYARNVSFQRENSKPGNATFELPLNDPSGMAQQVKDDMIIKFKWNGRERHGIVVTEANCELTTDGVVWVKYNNQPGLLSLFQRSVVMPEYMGPPAEIAIPEIANVGRMPKNAGTERLFGYMSKWGPWAIAADWVTPIGERWNEQTKGADGKWYSSSAKGANPAIFQSIDKLAFWIAAPPGPKVSVPEGTTHYFRANFTVSGTKPQTYFIYASGDNYLTMYVDGELIIEPDMEKPLGWLAAQKKEITLDPGNHVIAAHVLNGGVAVAPPLLVAKKNVPALSGFTNPLLGVTLRTGDRVLLTAQTNKTQNGTYVFYAAEGSGASARPNRLVKSSTANPLAFIMSMVFMSKVTGKPGNQIINSKLEDVAFALDSSTLTSAAMKELNAVAKAINVQTPTVTIEGHASTDGTASHNMWISEQRAKSVSNYLMKKVKEYHPGVVIKTSGDNKNWHVRWFGEEQPDYTPGTNPKNRRVEIAYTVAEPGVNPGDVLAPTVVRRSDTNHWLAHDGTPVPGWFRWSVIKKLVEEAKAIYISGFAPIKLGATDLVDSDSKPWQNRGQFSFPLVTTNLLDVTEQLTEDDLDLELDAESFTLMGWQRRGRDLTQGDRPVRLSVGHGLMDYQTTRLAPLATMVIARLNDGTWFELKDELAYARYGRRVVGLSMNSALDANTARKAAQTLLDENSHPTITVTARTSAASGPQPMVDYDIGDTVLLPGHKGAGVMPARCLSITGQQRNDGVEVWAEFAVDPTSPSYDDEEIK